MKKIFNFAIALTAVLAFTACGSDDEGSVIVPATPLPAQQVPTEALVALVAQSEASAPVIGSSSRLQSFEAQGDRTATITYLDDVVIPTTRTTPTFSRRVEIVEYNFTQPNANKRIYEVLTAGSRVKKIVLDSDNGFTSGTPIITLTLSAGEESNPTMNVTSLNPQTAATLVNLFRTWEVMGTRIKLFGRTVNGRKLKDNYFKYYTFTGNGCDFESIKNDLREHDADIKDGDGFDKFLQTVSVSPAGKFTLKYRDGSTDGAQITGGITNIAQWFVNWYEEEEVNKYVRDAVFSASWNPTAAGVSYQLLISATAQLEEDNYESVVVEFYLNQAE